MVNMETMKEYTKLEIENWSGSDDKFLRKEDVLGLIDDGNKGNFWDWCRNNKNFDYMDKTKLPIDFIEAYEEYLKERIEV